LSLKIQIRYIEHINFFEINEKIKIIDEIFKMIILHLYLENYIIVFTHQSYYIIFKYV